MPFCTQCGHEHPQDAKVCPNCGKAIIVHGSASLSAQYRDDFAKTVANVTDLGQRFIAKTGQKVKNVKRLSGHPGQQLILFSKVAFFVIVIGCTAGGAAIGYGVEHDDDYTILGAIIGLVAGFIIAWFTTIILRSFGEMTENTTLMREQQMKKRSHYDDE